MNFSWIGFTILNFYSIYLVRTELKYFFQHQNKKNSFHFISRAGIRSIFNLQSRNEHKDCGQGILKESGFSYDPNDFIKEEGIIN